MPTPQETVDQWTREARQLLQGRTIADVRYMTEDEAGRYAWYERPLVLILDDGTELFPSRDDEGNGGGALFGRGGSSGSDDQEFVFPVMR
jgi:hypothetical protein